MINTILLQAQGGQGSSLSGIIMIVAMIAIFYFFMIRPQSKKQKEIKKAREAMTKGDKVVTAGGIHGTIREISADTLLLEISKGVSIRVDKASVYPAAPEAAKAPAAKKEEKPAKEAEADDKAE